MILHTFLEHEKGQFKTIKKFLHYTGYNTEVSEKDKNSEALCEVHTITIITKESNAKNIAYEFAKNKRLRLIESYDCTTKLKMKYENVPQITTVADIDKTNEGMNMLSNWLYAFIYPEKYKDYSIYRIDYVITYKMKYNKEVDYSINENRDEIIYSLNKEVKKQILQN